jgi:putative transposase
MRKERRISSRRQDDLGLRACQYARHLDAVLDDPGSKRAAVLRAASELQLSTRQIYNLLTRYRKTRTVTALMPGVDNGRRKRLSSGVEAIIAATLREQWLVLEAPPLAGVVILHLIRVFLNLCGDLSNKLAVLKPGDL